MIRVLISVFLFCVPSIALSCSPPWYRDFAQYIQSFQEQDEQYQIVYGRFISISEIEVEDVTDELRSEFSDSDFIAKKLTASAVFELIDPIPRRHRNRLVDVTIWETWSNYTWSCRPEKPRDNAYLDVSFSSFLGRDSEVLAFEIGPDGALTYRIPLFFTHFREPFTPTQRRALGRCIFNGACEPRNLYSLRNLEPVSR
ncbi:MAG: hypothetical protein COB08_013725 [Rhodobacteraceae bacterium]|nr:hypothetical protein [Paracoccaceae bacterium]